MPFEWYHRARSRTIYLRCYFERKTFIYGILPGIEITSIFQVWPNAAALFKKKLMITSASTWIDQNQTLFQISKQYKQFLLFERN